MLAENRGSIPVGFDSDAAEPLLCRRAGRARAVTRQGEFDAIAFRDLRDRDLHRIPNRFGLPFLPASNWKKFLSCITPCHEVYRDRLG